MKFKVGRHRRNSGNDAESRFIDYKIDSLHAEQAASPHIIAM